MDEDLYQPGSAVEPELLLKYLIEKAEELVHKEHLRFPYVFKGLGVAALTPFPALRNEFLDVMRSEDPMTQRASRCREIFNEALACPEESNTNDVSAEAPRFDPVLSNQFAWEARRDGDRMLERHDFRFQQVWESMAWIALQGHTQKFKKFLDVCVQYTDPEQRIEAVIPLLWEVMTIKRTTDVYGSDGPAVETALLLRFLIKRYDELLETQHPRISVALGGLSLAGAGRDDATEKELKSILYPTAHPDDELLRRCKAIFQQTLDRIEEGDIAENPADDLRLPRLDESVHRQMLIGTLREGRRMIADENYEFAQIIKVLGWASLRCYPSRLREFEVAWQSQDPAQATRKAVEVLRAALRQRDSN